MARRNRRAPDEEPKPVNANFRTVAAQPDGEWVVQRVTGSDKGYRCPGCEQEIAAGVAHVVAWPAERDVGERRHWHTPCWNARARRTRNRRG